jgi:hypothetical protein
VAGTWANDATPEHITFKTETGEPPATILATATSEGVDLIVVGTQGPGGIRKWLIGVHATTLRAAQQTCVVDPRGFRSSMPSGERWRQLAMLADIRYL